MNTEEFIKRAKKVHGDKYDYSKTVYTRPLEKVIIICPKHGEFLQLPYNHLKGMGCRKCNSITTEEFIEKAREIHGDKYDYSKVKYINSYTKVTIICPVHGEFQQDPMAHLDGHGCRKCESDSRRLGKEEFIKRSKEIHGDRFDYSKVEYVNMNTPVTIICPIHGKFRQTPNTHLRCDCPKCSKERVRNVIADTKEDFIRKAREIHGDKYDYSKVEYVNTNTNVTIICPVHGEFQQRPSSHLEGIGCEKCAIDSRRLGKEGFIKKAREVHGDKYDYSKVEYINNKTKVTIICPIHGEFQQTPNCHLRGGTCPECTVHSKLEDFMKDVLTKHNVRFYSWMTWPWLIYKSVQSVDLYLPEYNIAIECQGIQHFESVEFFGGEEGLKSNIERDENKRRLCEEHGIKIIYFSDLSSRLRKEYQYPYKVYEDVSELFKEELHLEIN